MRGEQILKQIALGLHKTTVMTPTNADRYRAWREGRAVAEETAGVEHRIVEVLARMKREFEARTSEIAALLKAHTG
jgi:hypothetical protein